MVVKGNESLCRALRCDAMTIDAWIDERKSQEEEEKEEDRQGNGIHFRTSGGARTIRNTCQSPEQLSLSLSLSSLFFFLYLRLFSLSQICSALLWAAPGLVPRLVATTMTDGPDTPLFFSSNEEEARVIESTFILSFLCHFISFKYLKICNDTSLTRR